MKPLLILAALCCPLSAAISNPVKDYLGSEHGTPEENQKLLAIPCDLDRDGTKDYLISNGRGLEEKFSYAEWIFYRGIRGGKYEKFDHAIDESNASEPIVIVPDLTELVEVPGTRANGFTRVREMVDAEIPQVDEVRPRSMFRWAFYFSRGQMRKKLLMKTNDRAIYKPWFEFKPSELTLDAYRAEADRLRQGKSGQLAMVKPAAKPRNYAEIKALVDRYAMHDEVIDDDAVAARAELYARGEKAVPALLILFQENPDPFFRSRLMNALKANRGQKKTTVEFIVRQLQGNAEEWNGSDWIMDAIELLTEADPAQARVVSRRALASPSALVKHAGMRSLGAVGTPEDIAALKEVVTEWEVPKEGEPPNGYVKAAEKAIQKITERAASKDSK